MRGKSDPSFTSTAALFTGFALLMVLLVAIFAFVSRQRGMLDAIQRSAGEIQLLARVGADLVDAETGQRGYLLTGERSYLVPYHAARARIADDFKALRDLTGGDDAERGEIGSLSALAEQKLAELGNTIDLYSADRANEALALVKTGVGDTLMREVRSRIETLSSRQQRQRDERRSAARAEGDILRFGALAAVMVAVVVGAASFIRLRGQLDSIAAARDALGEANAALAAEAARRAELADQLQQSQKMEAIGQLTGGLAHDFNNMLAVAISGIDLAKRQLDKPNGDPRRFLDAARTGVERAAELTRRLLAFARRQPLAPKPIDPNRMVADMAELLRRTLGEIVQLETVLADGLWRIHADSTQWESLILNLAVNARDAMPEGGKLTIETNNVVLDADYAARHVGIPAGEYVLLAVTDTGSGMSREIAERIFDPFFTTKPVGKGTGLGLSQVYGFVRQSGGHINVYSEPGHGTTMKVYMPRYVGPHEEAGAAKPSGPPPRGSLTETVLLVEDDENVRQLALDSVVEIGYKVVAAASAAEALRKLENEAKIDLLFTDVVMPEMNGRKLVEEARRIRPKLKVLFTTGFTQNSIVHGGVLDRGVDLIMKPYPVDGLTRKIRELLDRPD